MQEGFARLSSEAFWFYIRSNRDRLQVCHAALHFNDTPRPMYLIDPGIQDLAKDRTEDRVVRAISISAVVAVVVTSPKTLLGIILILAAFDVALISDGFTNY